MTIVPDFDRTVTLPVHIRNLQTGRAARGVGGSALFWRVKPVADFGGALLILPVVLVLAALLLVLNPVLNPGPLMYSQQRMGRNRVPFTALKFRTMSVGGRERGPDEPVEQDRITPLGRIFRKMGLDELPQAVNVLRGEMSLIGPRPDCVGHAEAYIDSIPEYRHRFCIRPGMSGLSQISLGYAAGTEATRAKARRDLDYIERAGFRMDLWIVWRTLATVAMGRGD